MLILLLEAVNLFFDGQRVIVRSCAKDGQEAHENTVFTLWVAFMISCSMIVF